MAWWTDSILAGSPRFQCSPEAPPTSPSSNRFVPIAPSARSQSRLARSEDSGCTGATVMCHVLSWWRDLAPRPVSASFRRRAFTGCRSGTVIRAGYGYQDVLRRRSTALPRYRLTSQPAVSGTFASVRPAAAGRSDDSDFLHEKSFGCRLSGSERATAGIARTSSIRATGLSGRIACRSIRRNSLRKRCQPPQS